MSGPLVLGIDTSGVRGSLALARGESVVAEVELHSADGFEHLLFDEIAALLERAGVTLGAIDIFAAAKGPGSFTGVRVGMAAAKGMAAALGKPAAGISNLQALAAMGEGELRAAVLDARRGDVYGAVYTAGGELVLAETVGRLEEWQKTLPSGVCYMFQDAAPYAGSIGGAGYVAAGWALAGSIARLAPGRAGDPGLLDANYVRKADAELFWEDRKGG